MASTGEQDRISEILLCGVQISRKLQDRCPGFPIQVETLIDMTADALTDVGGNRFQINFFPRNYRASAIIGTIEVYANHADIFYDRDQNFCWRRFIVTKELCHLLFAPESNDHLTSTPEEVEMLLDKILAGIDGIDFEKDHAASCDQSTILMALEILLPHSERTTIMEMISKGSNPLDIAQHYKVPQNLVRVYLSPKYQKSVEIAYKHAGV